MPAVEKAGATSGLALGLLFALATGGADAAKAYEDTQLNEGKK